MEKLFDVSCVIPQTGRTLVNFLNKIKELGGNTNEVDAILSVVHRSKESSSRSIGEVQAFIRSLEHEAPPCFAIVVDRKRPERPYRIGFLGHEWDIEGIRVRVEGGEPHNGSSLIRLDEVDLTVVGLDELLSMTQHYLYDPTTVTKWGMYNYHLEKPTNIRVAGSAQLGSYHARLKQNITDMVGFFLISREDKSDQTFQLEKLSQSGQGVFVKGRYTGIVQAAYPQLKLISVHDVETAVLNAGRGSVGIEIVQSGNTVRSKGLILHGTPLFLSESLYVVDYNRYHQNNALSQFVQLLNPVGYFDESHLRAFAEWFYALESNLKEAWIQKPSVTQLFCDLRDPENGLRPYRLQTHYWKPDDSYQRNEALATVIQAQKKLQQYYHEIQARNLSAAHENQSK